jgi:hypothetical protein
MKMVAFSCGRRLWRFPATCTTFDSLKIDSDSKSFLLQAEFSWKFRCGRAGVSGVGSQLK